MAATDVVELDPDSPEEEVVADGDYYAEEGATDNESEADGSAEEPEEGRSAAAPAAPLVIKLTHLTVPAKRTRQQKPRTNFTEADRKRLLAVFAETPNPKPERILELAQELKKEKEPVRQWFSRQRRAGLKAASASPMRPPSAPAVPFAAAPPGVHPASLSTTIKLPLPPSLTVPTAAGSIPMQASPTSLSPTLPLKLKPQPLQTLLDRSQVRRDSEVLSPVTPGSATDSDSDDSQGSTGSVGQIQALLANPAAPLTREHFAGLIRYMKRISKEAPKSADKDLRIPVLKRVSSLSAALLAEISANKNFLSQLKKWAYTWKDSETQLMLAMFDLWPKLTINRDQLVEYGFGKVAKKISGKNPDKSVAKRAGDLVEMWRERFLANQDGPGAGDAPAKSVEEKKPRPAPKEDGVEAKPKQMKPKVEVKPEATKPADAKVKVEASKAKAPEIKAEGKAGSAPPRPAGAPAKPAAGAKPPVPAAKPAPAAPAKASNFDVFRDLLDPMEYKTKVKKQDAAQQASARAKELQEDLDVVEEVRPETHDAGVPPDYAEDMMLPPIEGDGDDMHAPYLEDYMELEYPGKRPGAEDAGPDGPTVKRARTDSSFGIPGFSAVPVRGILKKVPKRSGKKVRWASEDALRMVRVFVPDESEINHERRYRNARDMDVSEGRQAMDSIRNLMQPALKEWPGHLQRLVLPAWDPAMVAVPGAESTEREVQERRDRTVLELSFDVGPPPDNPKEPDPGAPTAEVIPKEIRLDPIGAPPFELPALASSATYSLPVPGGTFQPVALGGSDAMSWDGRPPTWSPPQEQGFPAQALSASNLSSLAALLQQSQGQYAAQPAQQNTYGGFGSTGHGPPPQQSHSYPGYPAHSQSTMVGQSFSGQQSPPYQGSGAQQYGTYGQGQNFEAAQLLENVSRVMQTLPGFAQAAQPSMHPVSSFSQASYPQTSTSYPSQSTGSYPQTSAAPYGADNQAWNTQGQSSFHGDTGSGRGRGGFRGGGRQGILPGGGYENPKPCKFFEKGRCRNGQKCWNLHCDQRGQIVEVTDGSLRLAQRSGT